MNENALEWQPKLERREKKTKNYRSDGWKNSQNGKDSADDQLQEDQRRSKFTCEHCYNQKTPM